MSSTSGASMDGPVDRSYADQTRNSESINAEQQVGKAHGMSLVTQGPMAGKGAIRTNQLAIERFSRKSADVPDLRRDISAKSQSRQARIAKIKQQLSKIPQSKRPFLTSAESNLLKSPEIADALGTKADQLLHELELKFPEVNSQADLSEKALHQQDKIREIPRNAINRRDEILQHMRATTQVKASASDTNVINHLIVKDTDGLISSELDGLKRLLSDPLKQSEIMGQDKTNRMFEKIEKAIGLARPQQGSIDSKPVPAPSGETPWNPTPRPTERTELDRSFTFGQARKKSSQNSAAPQEKEEHTASSSSSWVSPRRSPPSAQSAPFMRKKRGGAPTGTSAAASSSSKAQQQLPQGITDSIQQMMDRAETAKDPAVAAKMIKEGIASLHQDLAGSDTPIIRDTKAEVLGTLANSDLFSTLSPNDQKEIVGKIGQFGTQAKTPYSAGVRDAVTELSRKLQKHQDNPKKAASRFERGFDTLQRNLDEVPLGKRPENAAFAQEQMQTLLDKSSIPNKLRPELQAKIDEMIRKDFPKYLRPGDIERSAKAELNQELRATKSLRSEVLKLKNSNEILRDQLAELDSERRDLMVSMKSFEDDLLDITIDDELRIYHNNGTLPPKVSPDEAEQWAAKTQKELQTRNIQGKRAGVNKLVEEFGSVESAIHAKKRRVGELEAQSAVIKSKIDVNTAEIETKVKAMRGSSTRLLMLTGSLNRYLAQNDPDGAKQEYQQVYASMCESYTTAVCLGAGNSPPTLSPSEFQLFAVIHSREADVQSNVRWDAYVDPRVRTAKKITPGKVIEGLQTGHEFGFIQSTELLNRTANNIVTDILLNSQSPEEALMKAAQYSRVGSALVEQGNVNMGIAVAAAFGNGSVAKMQSRGYIPTLYQGSITKVKTQGNSFENYRIPYEVIAREGGIPFPYLGTYLTDRTFIDDGVDDKAKAIEILNRLASTPEEKQADVRELARLTGLIRPRVDSPLRTDAHPDVVQTEAKVNQLFPRK